MQGVQAIAKAAPATIGPPLPARSISASTCHSRLRRATKSEATKRTPMAMISAAEIFSAARGGPGGWSRAPVAVSPRTMKIAEKLATKSRLGTRTRRQSASSSSAGGDAGDRREVAGDQRQHAGREEGDEARAEGGEDPDSGGGIGADLAGAGSTHPSDAAHGTQRADPQLHPQEVPRALEHRRA